MKLLASLLLSCVLISNVAADTSGEPSFEPYNLGNLHTRNLVTEKFREALFWDKDFFLTSSLLSNSKTIEVGTRKFLLTHFYMVGEGFSDDKFDSLQYITIQESDSHYLLFRSGAYMPECEASSWDFDNIELKAFDGNSNKILLIAKRQIHGCLNIPDVFVTYSATYDIDSNNLLKIEEASSKQ